jgi:hypothetical protein
MRPMRYRGWTIAAAALALIGAPQLRGYCLTACNTAGVARAGAQAEVASSSASCHDSSESPSSNPSSNPAAPGQDGCCDHTRVVQGALPMTGPAHNLEVLAVAPNPAMPEPGLRRELAYAGFAAAAPGPSRSLGVLRL